VYGWKTGTEYTDKDSESVPKSSLSHSNPDSLEPILYHLAHADAANGVR